MTRFRWLQFAAVPLAAVALATCGGSGGDSKDNDTSPVVQTGEPLDDDAYLRVFCTGLTEYQDALMTATTVEEIGEVVDRYVASLREINPPDDLRDFQQRYIEYLESAREDPTSLTVLPPPLPGEDARERLLARVPDIDECKYPTFLEVSSTE